MGTKTRIPFLLLIRKSELKDHKVIEPEKFSWYHETIFGNDGAKEFFT